MDYSSILKLLENDERIEQKDLEGPAGEIACQLKESNITFFSLTGTYNYLIKISSEIEGKPLKVMRKQINELFLSVPKKGFGSDFIALFNQCKKQLTYEDDNKKVISKFNSFFKFFESIYIKSFPSFLDDAGKIRPELLDTDAQSIASEFKRANLTTNQLRKFFDEVKLYQRIIDTGKKKYEDLKPQILMLKSKAKYAANKKDHMKDMKKFYEFIRMSINQIKSGENEEDQFEAFCLFFEAVYGFADLKES